MSIAGSAVKEFIRKMSSMQNKLKSNVPKMMFIQELNEPVYINPPRKILLSDLAVSLFVLLLSMICAYKALAIIFCIYFIYFCLVLKSFGKMWQLFGYSSAVLTFIIIAGFAIDAVIALSLQKYFIALLKLIYSKEV
jgi:hypothetical protein